MGLYCACASSHARAKIMHNSIYPWTYNNDDTRALHLQFHLYSLGVKGMTEETEGEG